MNIPKTINLRIAAVLLSGAGFIVGCQSTPGPTASPVKGAPPTKVKLEAMSPMTTLDDSKPSTTSTGTPQHKKPTKPLSVAEILNKSDVYRASGGVFEVRLLWHAESIGEIKIWGEKIGVYPFKQWPAKKPEVLVLRSTEGSGRITQQTLYSFVKLSESEWELRNMSVVVGDATPVLSFDEASYTIYAKTTSGQLLSAIALVGYQPTPEEEAKRAKESKELTESLRKNLKIPAKTK
jgi:hypothetical protein